jgi:D-alanyl-D-alanine carboxypeptidase
MKAWLAASRPSRSADLPQLADALVAAGAPGAALITVDGDGEVQRAASGMADLRTGRPMEAALHFRAGSVTKAFVATTVLALASSERLALSDTVERWLPGILPYGENVTLRQLLNHTAGVPNYPASVWQAMYTTPEGRFRSWTPRQLVALVADQPPTHPPGARWSYSNVGYCVLGLVVEAATDDSLRAALDRLIFEPLSLRHTTYPVHETDIPSPSAAGYSPPIGPNLEVGEGPLDDVTELNPSLAGPAGAVISNLPDLCEFHRALLGGRLLPSSLLREMLTTVPVPPESLPLPLYHANGLGLVEVETPDGPMIASFGGILGYLSAILSTPDGSRQAGVMINVGDRAPSRLESAFVDMVLRRLDP